MSTAPNEAPPCIFCQIIAGQRPAEIIYRTPSAVAFLDAFPAARGHTLVVPRQHAPDILQLDEGAAGALFGTLLEVMERLSATLQPAGFNVGWNHGAAAGQHVFHLHVHVLPRFNAGGGGVQAVGEGPAPGALQEIARAIRGSGPAREPFPAILTARQASCRSWCDETRLGPTRPPSRLEVTHGDP